MDYKTAQRTARKRALASRRSSNLCNKTLSLGHAYYVIYDDRYKGKYGVDCYPTAWNRPVNVVVGYYDPQGEYHLAPWWDESTGWITGPVVCNSVWW